MPEAKDFVLDKVRNLPDNPGVYRFHSQKGKIIYIGKAKSLRKRVGSYFNSGRNHSYRIGRMVSRVRDISYTVTNSEVEALLLENNLIKTHQPRYNILLKDGKTYPYICIKNERFPRVFPTRNKVADGSLYFGPYPSVSAMNAILNLIRGFISLRTCNYHLSKANIEAGKFKRCLEYQIGNCAAPCEDLQSEEDYNEGIEQVKEVLRGNLGPITRALEAKMKAAAEEYAFEKAEFFKKRIAKVKAYRQKNKVVSGRDINLEVLTVLSEEHLAIVNHFKIVGGAIVQTHSWETNKSLQESDEEILLATFEQLLVDDNEVQTEICTNLALENDELDLPESFVWQIPKRGDKKHLVDLSLKNCQTLLTEKLYTQKFKKRKSAGELMVEALQADLRLSEPPRHIECFDNSNFQGSAPVASVVVFRDGKPAKKDYRHFKIKTVEGPNDFASMEEIVFRRYRRMLDEEQELPQLIVIDGGKGQLSSAAASLHKLGLLGEVPIIGIAKRLEEIYRVGDPIPLHLDKKSASLRLIQQIRNEAHRFAITFHRQQRSKAPGQRSGLTNIPGIGPESEKAIIRQFRSVKKLKAASAEERAAKLGPKKARLIADAIEKGII